MSRQDLKNGFPFSKTYSCRFILNMEAMQGMAIGANKLENCKPVLLSVILSHTPAVALLCRIEMGQSHEIVGHKVFGKSASITTGIWLHSKLGLIRQIFKVQNF
jgi:hypothetical protein